MEEYVFSLSFIFGFIKSELMSPRCSGDVFYFEVPVLILLSDRHDLSPRSVFLWMEKVKNLKYINLEGCKRKSITIFSPVYKLNIAVMLQMKDLLQFLQQKADSLVKVKINKMNLILSSQAICFIDYCKYVHSCWGTGSFNSCPPWSLKFNSFFSLVFWVRFS